jgi:hypothetical protein
MSVAHSGIDNLLDKIEKAEKRVKEIYRGKTAKVKMANARQMVDYEFGKDINQMGWAVRYLQELGKLL